MKRFLFFLCAAMVFSCGESNNNKKTEEQGLKRPYRLERWARSWVFTHPDVLKNQITQKAGEKQLHDDFMDLVERDPDMFKDLPYYFLDMIDCGGGEYGVKFEAAYGSIAIVLFAKIPEAEAAKLRRGNYLLSFDSIECAENTDFILISSGVSKPTSIFSDAIKTYNLYPDNLVASGLKFTPYE